MMFHRACFLFLTMSQANEPTTMPPPRREDSEGEESSDEEVNPPTKKNRGKGRVVGSTLTVGDAMAQNIDEHCESGRQTVPTDRIYIDEALTQGQIRSVDVGHVRRLIASFEANPPRDPLEITVWDATGKGALYPFPPFLRPSSCRRQIRLPVGTTHHLRAQAPPSPFHGKSPKHSRLGVRRPGPSGFPLPGSRPQTGNCGSD